MSAHILVRTIARVCAEMFLQIRQSRKELAAVRTIERLAIMQTKMRSQPIASVEGFLTSIFSAFKRFDLEHAKVCWSCAINISNVSSRRSHLRVHPHMDLQRIRSQESFPTTVLVALKPKLAFMRLQVGAKIADRAVRSWALVIVASVSGNYRRIASLRIWIKINFAEN